MPTAEGDHKHGLVKDPPPRTCPLRYFLRPFIKGDYSQERHSVRVEDASSTLTSRIRSARQYWIAYQYRPGASRRRTARACMRPPPIPLYNRYPDPVPGSVAGPCFPSSVRLGLSRTVHTPPVDRGVSMLHHYPCSTAITTSNPRTRIISLPTNVDQNSHLRLINKI